MKSILAAAAISLLAAGSALASSELGASDQAKFRASKAMVLRADSNDVYVGGHLIGRDPDPAIQARLRDEYYALGR